MADIEPLVSPQWLSERLAAGGICVLDIRSVVDGGSAAAYEAAHVPGAIHTDYVKDGWRATKGMATGLLPDKAYLAALFGRIGLTPSQHVVIVGAGTSPGDFCAAARVYWTLKIAGHGAVSILDGGMAAWQAAGLPVATGREQARPGPVYPVAYRSELHADAAAVQRAIDDRHAVLLDSRSTGYFEGREKSPQAKRAGRLPHAVQLDYTRAFDAATRRLKPVAELQALFAGLPALPIVNYCNTGQQAAANWFVLSELLHRPATLYDGSMSEWTEDETRPVEVGS